MRCFVRSPSSEPVVRVRVPGPVFGVSILIRPSGRMQQGGGRLLGLPSLCFNPHPTFRPDATRRLPRGPRSAPRFNPHPTFRPDATSSFAASKGTSRCFNPHPTFRPDATAPVDRRAPHLQVSILIRPSGRMQQGYLREKIDSALMYSFNPHPTFRPDATSRPWRHHDARAGFQSSSDLQAGCNSTG